MADSKVIRSGPVSTGGVSHHPVFAVGAVLLGAVLANFDTRIFSVGLPDLRGALSLSFDEGTWLSTAGTASQMFVAPAVAWLATVFGLRRVLGIPALIFAAISLLIPLVRDFHLLLALNIAHGLLLGTFVPATLMIAFRNLPMQWWMPAIAIYSARVGFTVNSSTWMVGFYVEHLGWQWMFWQDAIVAPLLALFVWLGTPHEPVNTAVREQADWGGMLLLGAGIAMIYAGLDQGNRLDWLGSGTVVALLAGGAGLVICFLINESIVKRPWAHAEVILSRNIGLALLGILFFSLTGLTNSSLAPNFLTSVALLRPEQSGTVFMIYGVLPMIVLVPLAIYLVRHYDARLTLIIGLMAFAAAALLGTQLTHEWAPGDFIPMVLLLSVGQSFTLLPILITAMANSDPKRSTAFSAYLQVVRLGGAEIGIALMATWLRVREQVHSNLLGQHVASGDADTAGILAKLSGRFLSHGEGLAQSRGTDTLAGMVAREANTLAYIDGFWLTFWLAIVALISVSMIARAPPGPFTPKPHR
jgi:DHA2 family multidrug resistance protein